MDVHLDVDCGCCGDECSSQCRYKAWTATLVGYSEFTEQSLPPKKYRVLTASGTRGRCAKPLEWPGGGSDSETYSGSNFYSKTTGVKTVASSCVIKQTMHSCPAGGYLRTDGIAEGWMAGVDCYVVNTVTKTKCTSTGTGAVCPKQEDGSYTAVTTGTLAVELSDEDTETDAETRAKAQVTAWTYPADNSCANLASFRTARGNTFSWSWTQVQRRGVTPDYDATMATQAVYRVVLKWYTTATNANGAVVSEGLVELTHSPGWVGDIYTEWADIPIPEAGLFAYAGECRISLVSAGVPRPPNPEET